jgi:hypothetical protein
MVIVQVKVNINSFKCEEGTFKKGDIFLCEKTKAARFDKSSTTITLLPIPSIPPTSAEAEAETETETETVVVPTETTTSAAAVTAAVVGVVVEAVPKPVVDSKKKPVEPKTTTATTLNAVISNSDTS